MKPGKVKESDLDRHQVINEVNVLRKAPVHGAIRKGSMKDVAIDCVKKHKRYGLDN